jgi:lipoprotein-releasing system permease protein
LLIAAIAFLLTVLATIYPALRGAATHPAEALRYE